MSKRPADEIDDLKPPMLKKFKPINIDTTRFSPLNLGESHDSSEIEAITISLNSIKTDSQESPTQPRTSPQQAFSNSGESASTGFGKSSDRGNQI